MEGTTTSVSIARGRRPSYIASKMENFDMGKGCYLYKSIIENPVGRPDYVRWLVATSGLWFLLDIFYEDVMASKLLFSRKHHNKFIVTEILKYDWLLDYNQGREILNLRYYDVIQW